MGNKQSIDSCQCLNIFVISIFSYVLFTSYLASCRKPRDRVVLLIMLPRRQNFLKYVLCENKSYMSYLQVLSNLESMICM